MRKLVLVFAFFIPVTALAGEIVKVKVQKSTIFHEPKFFSEVVASVRYGDELEMFGELRDWSHVEFQEKKGWIHKSGLTSTKINLGTIFVGSPSSSATYDEVALAGKGFTPEIEQGYKQSHPEMNYVLVDEVERYNVQDDSLYRFIEQGGLKIGEGE